MADVLTILENLPADIAAAVPLIQAAVADAENIGEVITTDVETLITNFKAYIDSVTTPPATTDTAAQPSTTD